MIFIMYMKMQLLLRWPLLQPFLLSQIPAFLGRRGQNVGWGMMADRVKGLAEGPNGGNLWGCEPLTLHK